MNTNNFQHTLAPIVLFVYNRPDHTRKTLEALAANHLFKDSCLFIFSDGPKNDHDFELVQNVRYIVRGFNGCRKIRLIENKYNKGLANNIIAGVSDIIQQYSNVIVMEDDLISSPSFLTYMNELLHFYEKTRKVASISGYNLPDYLMKIPPDYTYDVYFNFRPSSWGWATWQDYWEEVDWDVKDFYSFFSNKKLVDQFKRGGDDLPHNLYQQIKGKMDSWAIRWAYHHFKYDYAAVYPINSFINNIGNDTSGTHSKANKRFEVNVLNTKTEYMMPANIFYEREIIRLFKQAYQYGILKKFKHYLIDRL